MPKLDNRRHEWFAYLRAHGARLEEAYERAGYAPDRGHACRLASRPEVAERITELRSDFADVVTADRPRVIEALMSIGHISKPPASSRASPRTWRGTASSSSGS
jgi:hypothetical protein